VTYGGGEAQHFSLSVHHRALAMHKAIPRLGSLRIKRAPPETEKTRGLFMSAARKQTRIFQGIYEFEDPSGQLLAARTPQSGSIDLFQGTTVLVRPNQSCVFIYKGKVVDIFGPGTHEIQTENTPILTRLAHWRKGFQSPLRCDLWFFNLSTLTARRWGTSKPVLAHLDGASIPIRAFGHFSVRMADPIKFYRTLAGGKHAYDVSEVEEFVQGHLLECLPVAIKTVESVRELNEKQATVAAQLHTMLSQRLAEFGLEIKSVEVMSLLPPQKVLDALDERLAMQIIGDPKRYLLYKAASSLDQIGQGNNTANDPMQMMLGLVLGRGLMGYEHTPGAEPQSKKENEWVKVPARATAACKNCGQGIGAEMKFCPHCGKERK
jgi:membrane protease subunit (stomatin/prohibitin family)